MSTTPPESPTPSSAPSSSTRWTPQAVAGLLCLIAAVFLRRLLRPEGDPMAGAAIADALTMLGAGLIGWAPSLPGPTRPRDGSPLVGLLVGVGLAALTMVAPGCATTPRTVDALRFRYEEDPGAPPPACVLRIFVGDRELAAIHRPDCPKDPRP